MYDMDDDGKTELIHLVERALQDKRERDKRRVAARSSLHGSDDQLDNEVAFAADRLPNTIGFEPV